MNKKIIFNFQFSIFNFRKGNALLITLFVLAGILSVSLAAGTMVISGIKTGGIQLQSTKAYYAAESGVERVLWEARKNELSLLLFGSQRDIFSGAVVLNNTSNYIVNYSTSTDVLFTSIGEFEKTKRGVEVRF